MCQHVSEQYQCGHETKLGYVDCRTGARMENSTTSCGNIDFGALVYPKGPCDEPGCQYPAAMRRGWRCCACNKGPNKGEKCEQDTNSRGWKYVDCQHRFCLTCEVWDGKEHKKDKSKGKDKDTGSGGGSGGSATNETLQKSLRLVTAGVSSGSTLGM